MVWSSTDNCAPAAIQLRVAQTLSGTIAPRYGKTATLVCKNNKTGVTKTVTIKGTGTTGPVTAWDCEKAGSAIKLGDSVTVQFTGTISH